MAFTNTPIKRKCPSGRRCSSHTDDLTRVMYFSGR